MTIHISFNRTKMLMIVFHSWDGIDLPSRQPPTQARVLKHGILRNWRRP